VTARETWRRLRFGVATLLGREARGFFIPYRYASGVTPRDYPALKPVFRAAEDRMLGLLDAIDARAESLLAIQAGPGPARFDQGWFPASTPPRPTRWCAARGLAASWRSAPGIPRVSWRGPFRMRGRRPRSPASTPAPRATLAQLAVQHVPTLLQDADPALIAGLQAGDILFIDSSHVAMPGTDVDRLFLDVLPRLSPGVIVHVHDITLPDAYPAEWAWRGYNEQLLVGTLLQGGAYEILFASHYAARTWPERIGRGVLGRIPLQPGVPETSLWLRKRDTGEAGA
jgi:hypothetical protein